MNDLMTIAEACAYLHVSKNTLAQWRYLGTGPKYLNPTRRSVYYRQADIDAWLEASERTQTGIAA